LSGNNNIHNETYYVASNITFFLKNAEIICSVDKYQPSLRDSDTYSTML